MTLIAIALLLVLLTLFTGLQVFYLEGMRLRTRDTPSLQYFKSVVEQRLNLRSEEGALTFTLWKHTCVVLLTAATLANVIDGGTLSFPVLIESVAAAWLLMLLCTCLIPQLLLRRTTGHWLNPLLPFYSGAALVIRPVVLILNLMHSLLEVANEEAERDEPATSAENIEALITAGTEEGLIEEDDRKLIESVVAFGDKVVREVMTPRPNMVTIQADVNLEALRTLVVNEQYSRIPVYQSGIDDIIGFVHARDMFEVAESDRATRKVRELMRPIRFVPETKSVHDLMREMQQDGFHMVIVVDEYGATAGLATMEDLVEVILGEIRDEHEPESDVSDDGHGGFIVSGNFDIVRLADLVDFRPSEEIESTTIGGLVMEWIGRVPQPGEVIEREGIRVEVLASDEMRVERVRIGRVANSPEASEAVAK
jgi:putative hemolysin